MAPGFPDCYLNMHTLGATLPPTCARNYTPRMSAEFREVTPVVFFIRIQPLCLCVFVLAAS